jgi:hypothetical protein
VNPGAAFVDIGASARDISPMQRRIAQKAKKSSARGIVFSRAAYG